MNLKQSAGIHEPDLSSTPEPSRPRRKGVRVLMILLLICISIPVFIMIDVWSALGKRADGARLERMRSSPQYAHDRFVNPLPIQEVDMGPVLRKWLFGADGFREPIEPIPVIKRSRADFSALPSDVRITWFGHSTLLFEMDGRRILMDPVWGDYASPSRIFGVKRFYEPALPLEDLPEIDAVVLSHDHYDHLNEPTIRALSQRVPLFVAPLGVGAHLEYWGVPPERIVELDWWEQTDVGGIDLICTPARHFSGRAFGDRDATLWASWTLIGENRRLFFSGDTGLFPGFEEIGARYGPFDVTMLEVGAYNTDWPDSHLGPEQAIVAHQMLGGQLMLPIHWGLFNLAFHGWTEPVERLLVAAEEAGVHVAVPQPGQRFELQDPPPVRQWWPDLPWKTAAEVPIIANGMDTLSLENKAAPE